MSYPIPNRVAQPTMRPNPDMMQVQAQPPQMAGQFPPPLAAQPPQRRGLMGMAEQNPEMFLALGAGLLGGRTGREQWAGGLSGMAQAMGTAREKKEAKAKENATLKWLQTNAPEYADAVAQGVMSAGDAYKMTLEARKPKTNAFTEREQALRQYGVDPNSPEGRAFILSGDYGETNKPSSNIGKINADFNAGLIDQATRDAAIAKALEREGMEIVSDGQGGFTMRQGLGVGGGKLSTQDGKNQDNMLDAARQSAANATELKQTINMLRAANKDTGYSGPGGGLIGTGLDMAEKLGVDAWGSPGSRAIMRSGGLDVALQKVQQTKGAISNAEMNMFMAASPGMQQTAEGNAALLDMAESIANRAIQRVQEMESWRQRNGTVQGFEAAWSEYINSNPIVTEDKVLGQTPTGAQGGVQSYKDYFGGN